MRFWLFIALAAIFASAALCSRDVATAQETPPVEAPQLSPEHVQLLQHIVQQMPEEQKQALAQLPPEQQQAVLMQMLASVLPKQKEPIREWLQQDKDKSITFEKPDRYPRAVERIEDYIREKTERKVEVTAIAFCHDGHDHFFKYRRLFRAKYKTPKDGKEYVAEFLFEKEGPYLHVKQWRSVKDEERKPEDAS